MKRLIIIGVLIIIVIIVVLFLLFSQKKPVAVPLVITGSTPIENATGISVFDPITVTFNQTVNPGAFYVTSTPSETWDISQNTSNSIKFNHALYLKVATQYKLTIFQSGNIIGTLSFETAHEQNDPRLLQTLKSELDTSYPLASLTPYETTDFRVVYSAPLTFEIDLKSSIDSQTAISEVQSWVQSHGVNPSTHKYAVVAASPLPLATP